MGKRIRQWRNEGELGKREWEFINEVETMESKKEDGSGERRRGRCGYGRGKLRMGRREGEMEKVGLGGIREGRGGGEGGSVEYEKWERGEKGGI